jgi:hypothetical protein
MAKYDVTVVCKDCGKEVYSHYETNSVSVGSESVSCNSTRCEDDTKYVVSYGFAETFEDGTESGQIGIAKK